MTAQRTEVAIGAELCEPGQEVVITAWLVDNGTYVTKDAVICELMAEKAQMDFAAPRSGTIEILVEVEKPLRTGDVIAIISE